MQFIDASESCYGLPPLLRAGGLPAVLAKPVATPDGVAFVEGREAQRADHPYTCQLRTERTQSSGDAELGRMTGMRSDSANRTSRVAPVE